MTFPIDTIAVYGATGHTGRFVIEELLRRGCGPSPSPETRPDLTR